MCIYIYTYFIYIYMCLFDIALPRILLRDGTMPLEPGVWAHFLLKLNQFYKFFGQNLMGKDNCEKTIIPVAKAMTSIITIQCCRCYCWQCIFNVMWERRMRIADTWYPRHACTGGMQSAPTLQRSLIIVVSTNRRKLEINGKM